MEDHLSPKFVRILLFFLKFPLFVEIMSCKTNSREACIQVITAYILVVKNASGGVSGALYIFLYHSPFSTGFFFCFIVLFFAA